MAEIFALLGHFALYLSLECFLDASTCLLVKESRHYLLDACSWYFGGIFLIKRVSSCFFLELVRNSCIYCVVSSCFKINLCKPWRSIRAYTLHQVYFVIIE
jgi:hypothetical protein